MCIFIYYFNTHRDWREEKTEEVSHKIRISFRLHETSPFYSKSSKEFFFNINKLKTIKIRKIVYNISRARLKFRVEIRTATCRFSQIKFKSRLCLLKIAYFWKQMQSLSVKTTRARLGIKEKTYFFVIRVIIDKKFFI